MKTFRSRQLTALGVSLAVAAFDFQTAQAQDIPAQEATQATSAPISSQAAPVEASESAVAPESASASASSEAVSPAVASLNDVPPPPEGKGQIVFFRPSRFVGAAVSFSVREGDAGIGKLTNGTYFVHVADPGTKEYNISFEARDTLRMEVEAGETYYVVQSIGMGVVAARPNLTPSSEEAFQDKKLKVSKAKATDRK